jgi:hypothetical protein
MGGPAADKFGAAVGGTIPVYVSIRAKGLYDSNTITQ